MLAISSITPGPAVNMLRGLEADVGDRTEYGPEGVIRHGTLTSR